MLEDYSKNNQVAQEKISTKTHIAIVLDRSGSMSSIKDETIEGFNSFVSKQKGNDCTLTLVQFDDQDPYEKIYDCQSVDDIPLLTHEYSPRGMTPLLDAIGRAISDIDSMENKPEKIVLAIITDGGENDSKEYSQSQIQKLIKDKEAEGWQIVFLSSNLSAVQNAAVYNIPTASTMRYASNTNAVKGTWDVFASSVSSYVKEQNMSINFSDKDRATALEEDE